MRIALHQRCDRCDRENDPGCEELRRTLGEVDKVLAASGVRAGQYGLRLPPVELSAWCPAFWRKGRT